jgi:flagellar biosynthesis GTPase FlhF
VIVNIKAFFLGFLIVIGLFVVAAIASGVDARAGLVVGLALLVVPGIAIFKPIPALGLTHRGFSFSIAFFVGLMVTLASLGGLSENAKLKELRATDPEAYLAAISNNEDFWLKELKELAPERYHTELARVAAEREAAEREAARLKAEREAAEREAAAKRAQEQAAARQKEQEEKAEREAAERAAAAKRAQEQAAVRQKEQEEKAAAYAEKLEMEIDGLITFNPREYTDSQTSLTIGLALFSVWAQIYEDGSTLPLTDEQEALRQKFKRQVIAQQKRALPEFRDKYGPIMRKALWEHDGSAKTIGNQFATVEFISGLFATNQNIKAFQQSVSETLHLLRFKRAQYKWYKGADEYTYYDMETIPDVALVIWSENGRYRKLD